MRLHNITQTSFTTNNAEIEQYIGEMERYSRQVIQSCYVLNETTNVFELDQAALNEGLGDILRKGAQKISNIAMKGRVGLDQLKMNVADKVKSKLGGDVAGKLGQLAGKYAKPAVVMAVVGASLLGMDAAQANDAISQMDQMGGNEFSNYMDKLSNDFNNFQGGGGGGADAAQDEMQNSISQNQQAPQQQVAQADQASQGGAEQATQGGMNQAKSFGLDVAKRWGATSDFKPSQQELIQIVNGKFGSGDSFLQMVSNAMKSGNSDQARQLIQRDMAEALMNLRK